MQMMASPRRAYRKHLSASSAGDRRYDAGHLRFRLHDEKIRLITPAYFTALESWPEFTQPSKRPAKEA